MRRSSCRKTLAPMPGPGGHQRLPVTGGGVTNWQPVSTTVSTSMNARAPLSAIWPCRPASIHAPRPRRELAEQRPSPGAIIGQARALFAAEFCTPATAATRPERVSTNSCSTRRGFCEHYAGPSSS